MVESPTRLSCLRPVTGAVVHASVANMMRMSFTSGIWTRTRPSAAVKSGGRLLVAQSCDRIEAGRPARRIEPEEDSHDRRDKRRDGEGVRRNRHRPSQDVAQDDACACAEQEPEHAAEEGQHHRLAEELHLYRALRGADGEPDPDLASALGHGDEHHVHDAYPADDQRNGCDADEQHLEGVAGLDLGLDDFVGPANVEVVFLTRLDVVPLAQERGDLVDGWIHGLLRNCGAEDVVQPGRVSPTQLHLVVQGRIRVSSWSDPDALGPLRKSTPTTWKSCSLIRITCPTGSSSPKSCSRTVSPISTRLRAEITSFSRKCAPDETSHCLMSK